MRRLLVSVIVVLTVAIGAAQQEQFEVASVKLASFVPGPGAPVPSLKVSGNQLHIRVYPLLSLLTYIFEPPAGTFFYPDWVRTPDIRLEIDAVMPNGRRNKPDVQQMLRALLAERMGLTFHVEQRRIAAFDLVVASGGIRMNAVQEADEREMEIRSQPYQLDLRSYDGERRTITGGGVIRTITARSNFAISPFPPDGPPVKYVLDATRISMEDFVRELTGRVDRPVVDATGLTGVYRLTLDLPQLASVQRIMQRTGITTNVRGEPIDVGSASNVDVHKQLETIGLRLVERTAPTNVLVIDSLNKEPTEN
jgi:uncharacterized protein (TIGR03435 family)